MDPSGLRRLAALWNLPLGVVEKDHAITVALGVLAVQPFSVKMTFKGGTAIRKAYFPQHRFSEDLDFTADSDISTEIARTEKALMDAGRDFHVKFRGIQRNRGRGESRTLAIRYHDMNEHPNSIRVELSLREKIHVPPVQRIIIDPYDVLRDQVTIRTMNLREILAEKVRALHMRSQPRDLYDLWALVGEGIPFDGDLIHVKLGRYVQGAVFDLAEFEQKIARLEPTWSRDLGPLVPEVPTFETVASRVLRAARGIRSGTP